LGRFSSMDPENAGAELETPQSWNAYAYVHNNPMGFVDPDGRWRESYGDYFNTEPTCGPAWLTYGDFGEPTGLCDDDPWFIWGRGASEHMGAPPPGNAVADYLGEYNAAFSKLSPFMVAAWHGADGYNILF